MGGRGVGIVHVRDVFLPYLSSVWIDPLTPLTHFSFSFLPFHTASASKSAYPKSCKRATCSSAGVPS